MQSIVSNSPYQTKTIGIFLGEEIKKTKTSQNKALIIALIGDLGAGKTVFIKGLMQGLGIKKKIVSPTFIIFRRLNNAYNRGAIYHIDAYRLKKEKDILSLGFKQILAGPKNIVIIEWAERIKKSVPSGAIWIKLEYGQKNNQRIISFL
ncbi:MAG: tRNA (adenosine(37)-N6)-threonylcarbamoyltransferase complex ATPase subunit type 1 TsaE [Candidatus Liptonbacteria bacterium]|nr:tRNA (adenosine(37)-N6)-threonylcarbamoyltransferase complex ATPase subunit type 1 TsaE [Candidatus Liptonbacteria bacterium]